MWAVLLVRPLMPGAGTEADGTGGAMDEGDKRKVGSVCQAACVSLLSCKLRVLLPLLLSMTCSTLLDNWKII